MKITIRELLKEQGKLVEKKAVLTDEEYESMDDCCVEECDQDNYNQGFNQALDLIYGKEVEVGVNLNSIDWNKYNIFVKENPNIE